VADTPSSSAPETPKSNLPPERQDEDFQPIAQLVTPNPPEWFREYLHFCIGPCGESRCWKMNGLPVRKCYGRWPK
jgi:hypothetical protein